MRGSACNAVAESFLSTTISSHSPWEALTPPATCNSCANGVTAARADGCSLQLLARGTRTASTNSHTELQRRPIIRVGVERNVRDGTAHVAAHPWRRRRARCDERSFRHTDALPAVFASA